MHKYNFLWKYGVDICWTTPEFGSIVIQDIWNENTPWQFNDKTHKITTLYAYIKKKKTHDITRKTIGRII